MMQSGVAAMVYFYEKIEGVGVRILRIYGKGEVVVLPETLGQERVIELAPYLFSSHRRERTEEKPGVYVVLVDEDGKERHMKREFLENKDRHELCGSQIKEVYLPSGLKGIGRYAFFGCDKMRSLACFSSILDIGAGAFTGCRSLQHLSVHIMEERYSCLKELLSELPQALFVDYKRKDVCVKLVFPEFYEESVENTPARILETHVYGCGHRYRYCFQGTEFQFSDYDALFTRLKAEEQEKAIIYELALCRLLYPVKLSKRAAERYREYLLEECEKVMDYLLRRMDNRRCYQFIDLYCGEKDCAITEEQFERMIGAARERSPEAVSFLMERKRSYYAPKKRKISLDF